MAMTVGRSWERRLARARQLAAQNTPAASVLATYARLLEIQRDCFDALHHKHALLGGSLDDDLPLVHADIETMLTAVIASGFRSVADDATRLRDQGTPAWDRLMRSAWHLAFGQPFLARMFLQPYTECLAATGITPEGRPEGHAERTCPFCGGVPQLGILRSPSTEDGASRHLLCATCSTTWRTGRFYCPNCGEQDEQHLPYFQTTELQHLRIDACETCRHYLKTVDLTILGIAEPAVDEVAGGALDLWAAERGFRKIEVNLIGL